MKRVTTIVMLTVLFATGFAINQITAEESKSQYNFAENTTVSVIFHYASGETEVIPFEVFEQERGFDRSDDSMFKLEKVVGHTSLLHHTADESMEITQTNKAFKNVDLDVNVLISQGDKVIRQLDYYQCIITDNKITTKHDDDDGWHATSGFSLVDEFEFTCDGYTPHTPLYQEMNQVENAKNLSSNDLKDTSVWPQNMRVK